VFTGKTDNAFILKASAHVFVMFIKLTELRPIDHYLNRNKKIFIVDAYVPGCVCLLTFSKIITLN